MAELPILYSFRRCPYAMRARIALLVSGTDCIIREVALDNRPAALIAVWPRATVPVLVLPDGQAITESLEIMRFALQRHDPEQWLDGDDADLLAANDGPFKHHLDGYKYPGRHDGDPLVHRAAGVEILARLEARIGQHANLCGDGRTLTDIAIMPFVRQFAMTDRAWFEAQPLPAVQSWLARHIASSLFDQAMIRLAPWQDGDAPTWFPPILQPREESDADDRPRH